MSISIVGAVFIVFGIAGWLYSQRTFLIVLSASAALVTTAGVTVGGSSIPPFFLLATLATFTVAVDFARGASISHRSIALFGVMLGWSFIITALGPLLFGGIPVLDPRAGIDEQVNAPTPLAYTPSMAAQFAYLALGVGVVLYLASRNSLSPALLSPAIGLGTVMSAARLVPPLASPIDFLFRNYESAAYNQYEDRHFGIFAEPSYLAVFSVTAIAYIAFRLPLARGWRQWVLAFVGVLALVNLLASASGTAALSVLVLAAMAAAYGGWMYLVRNGAWRQLLPGRTSTHETRRGRGIRIVIVSGALIGILVLLVPNPISQLTLGTITEKIGTQSFVNRTSADLFSIQLLLDTYGLGVGLGANRPSSLLTLLLSSVGVIGTVLFAAAIGLALWNARARKAWRPVIVALIALLVAKVVAEPALSTPLLWLAVGACVYAGRQAYRPPSEWRIRFHPN